MTSPNTLFALPKKSGDKQRRRRWLRKVAESHVSPGCKSWLLEIAMHCSDDTAATIHGSQVNQARRLGRCTRTIRRYRAEAETANLIETERAEFDPEKGRLKHTNRYHFKVPKASPNRKKSTSGRADISCRGTNKLKLVKKPLRVTTPNNFAKLPLPLPDHDACGGTGWIERPEWAEPCECRSEKR